MMWLFLFSIRFASSYIYSETTIEGYLDSVPSLIFNTIKTKTN